MTDEDVKIAKSLLAMALMVAFYVGNGEMATPKFACDRAEEFIREIKSRGWEVPPT